MKLNDAECPSCNNTFPFYKYHTHDTQLTCPYCYTPSIVYLNDKAYKKDSKFFYNTVKVTLILLIIMVSNASYRSFILYEEDEYVCRHMARDLEITIEKFGIPVLIKRGDKINGDTGHMWINIYGLDIDSVTMIPSPMGLMYENIDTYDNYADYDT